MPDEQESAAMQILSRSPFKTTPIDFESLSMTCTMHKPRLVRLLTGYNTYKPGDLSMMKDSSSKIIEKLYTSPDANTSAVGLALSNYVYLVVRSTRPITNADTFQCVLPGIFDHVMFVGKLEIVMTVDGRIPVVATDTIYVHEGHLTSDTGVCALPSVILPAYTKEFMVGLGTEISVKLSSNINVVFKYPPKSTEKKQNIIVRLNGNFYMSGTGIEMISTAEYIKYPTVDSWNGSVDGLAIGMMTLPESCRSSIDVMNTLVEEFLRSAYNKMSKPVESRAWDFQMSSDFYDMSSFLAEMSRSGNVIIHAAHT